MIDKSSLLKSQGSLYLEFISKDGLFHKMLLLSLMGFLTGWCNLNSCFMLYRGFPLDVTSSRAQHAAMLGGKLSVAGGLGTFTHMFVFGNFAQLSIKYGIFLQCIFYAEATREAQEVF